MQSHEPAALLKSFKRALFVLPHPDDDLFFCGLIDMLKNEGCELHFLWLSIGGVFPKTRKREVSRIRSMIGVPAENCFVADLHDSMFWSNFESLASTIEETIRKVNPDVLLAPELEGGHVDHDACFLVCNYLARRMSRGLCLLSIPEYHLCKWSIAVGNCKHEKKEYYASIKMGGRLSKLRIKFFLNYFSQSYVLFPLLILGGIRFMTRQSFRVVPLNEEAKLVKPSRTLYKYFYPLQSLIGSCTYADFDSIQSAFDQFILNKSIR